jgi:4-amino-4-deoxy-L-arabinose transferase-like glycosyltransferase
MTKIKRILIIGIGILLLAFILRIYRLTALPIFVDEAIYIRWAQVMRAEETLRFLPLSDGKQPLFMWSVIPFLKLFADPLFAGRFTSVLTGLATVVGVFLVGKLLFKSKRVGFLAAVIYAISPFSVFFDRMALVDSMLAAFGIWTFYFMMQAVTKMTLDYFLLAGFSLGGALLTKSPALFFSLLLPSTWIFSNFPKGAKARGIHLLKLVMMTLSTYLVGYAMVNILRLGPNFHLLSSRNLDYVYPISHILASPLSPLLSHLNATKEYFWLLGPSTLLILPIVSLVLVFRKYPKQIILLSLWLFGPLFAVTQFAKVFTARYILFVLPFAVIMASGSLLIKAGFWKKIMTILLMVFFLHSLFVDFYLLTDIEAAKLPRSERSGYLEEWTVGTGIKEVSQYLKERHSQFPQERIVVGTEGYFGTLPDGLQIYLNDTPEIIVTGIGLGIDRVPQPLVESKNSGNKTYLLVNSTRLLTSADKLGLTLISAYPKAVKPDGFRESLLLFEVETSPTRN